MKQLEKRDGKWIEINEHRKEQSDIGLVLTLAWVALLVGLVASVG